MKAIRIEQQGNPISPNIRFVDDHPDPVLKPGQLLIKTEASALNHLDLWVGRGLPGAEEFPRISGSDGCGKVVAVGEGVQEDWMDRRVMINAAVPADPVLAADPKDRWIGRLYEMNSQPGEASYRLSDSIRWFDAQNFGGSVHPSMQESSRQRAFEHARRCSTSFSYGCSRLSTKR